MENHLNDTLFSNRSQVNQEVAAKSDEAINGKVISGKEAKEAFDKLPKEDQQEIAAEIGIPILPKYLVEKINAEHALLVGGENEGDIVHFLPEGSDIVYNFRSETQVRRVFGEYSLRSGKQVINPIELWLIDKRKRKYTDIGMYPYGISAPQGCKNLWEGFNVNEELMRNAESYDCKFYLKFILDVIVSGSKEQNEYLLDWLADAVQYPGGRNGKRTGIAVAMGGEEGVGKTFFATQFGALFGNNFITLHSTEQLTGRFNRQLEDKIVVLSDEAIWPGDKKGEGALKHLITGEKLLIEPKGIDIRTAKNYVHLITATNHPKIIPPGRDPRRYFVLKVSSAHKKDVPYFAAIAEQMRDGGKEKLLWLLLHRDISTRDFEHFPATEEFANQQVMNDPFFHWLYNLLQEGELPEEVYFMQQKTEWQEGRVKLSKERLREHFWAFRKRHHGFADEVAQEQFGIFMSEFFGQEFFRDEVARKVRLKGSIIGEGTRIYVFPSLFKMREIFDVKFPNRKPWENEPHYLEDENL